MKDLILLAVFCSVCFGDSASWQSANSLAIRDVQADKRVVKVFERMELDVDLAATFDNPFDSADISVDGEVSGSNGQTWSVPGFFYQPFKRNDSVEVPRRTEPDGEPGWKVRLSFPKAGRYTVRIKARDRSGAVESKPIRIRVSDADVAGMIRRSKKDHRYFVTDRGESWFAVGANVCWGQTWGRRGKHVFSYDDWFPKYAENGCNYARLWLSLEWNDLAIITTDSGYDAIDLQRAWHIDYVLQMAEKLDIRLMFCFDAHGMLRNKNRQHGFWEMSPLHPDNGAPITKPIEFFTNEKTLKAYRDRLRYLVARYGYSTSLFCWEFFNEVDLIDDYDSKLIADWHVKMAKYLRQIDPWDHLISTSYANSGGDPRVDGLKELDFVQTHHYQAPDIARDLGIDKKNKKAAKDRPHFHGEFGISHSGKETGQLDPTGIHLHNGLYSSIGRMDAGTAMTWWWDSYVHPRDMYHIFGAFAKWIDEFDFVEQNPQPIQSQFEWKPGAIRGKTDFVIQASGVSWLGAPYNKPVQVTVDPGGAIVMPITPGGILHGLRNHPDLHNPVTFELDVAEDTKFTVDVGDVSGFGGGELRITLDGVEKLHEEFVDKVNPEKGGKVSDFRGDYSIALPAGKHTVIVECVGKDWIMINGYNVPGLITPERPPLRASGIIGKDMGLVWVQNPQYTWTSSKRAKAIRDAVLILKGIQQGQWTVEYFDSHSAKVKTSFNMIVTGDGKLEIDLPILTWDAAFRLHRK